MVRSSLPVESTIRISPERKLAPFLRVIDCLTLLREHRLDAECLKTFQPQRRGLISITVIARDSFEFKKRCQLFVGSDDEPLSVAACAHLP